MRNIEELTYKEIQQFAIESLVEERVYVELGTSYSTIEHVELCKWILKNKDKLQIKLFGSREVICLKDFYHCVKMKISQEFYSDGQIRHTYNCLGDRKHGWCIEYYPNGHVKNQGLYKYGRREGEHCSYNINGRLSEQDYYKKDELHGYGYTYYENGEVAMSLRYKHGLLDGPCKSYNTDGTLNAEAVYCKGNRLTGGPKGG